MMLIDSVADISLLPKSCAGALGITATSERYGLEAFGGTLSESEAVRADLAFLVRRFPGQFLMVDSEIGVLGQDVLTQVQIRLDGPARRWEEFRSPAKDV